jgi:hypothetical protein
MQNRPQHVLDIRQVQAVRFAVACDSLFGQLAQKPDGGEQGETWNEFQYACHEISLLPGNMRQDAEFD